MQPLQLIPDNVPETLRDIDSWLVWKLVKTTTTKGEEKWLKVPYYTDGTKRRGVLGTPSDRKRLTTFSRALQVFQKGGYAGVGFAVMPDHEVTILDIDKCIDGKKVSAFAREVIESGTYVEKSPSGTGLRAVYTGGAVIPGKANGHIENGERVEIYCGSAYVTITGQQITSRYKGVIDLPDKLRETLSPVIAKGGAGGTAAAADGGDAIMDIEARSIPDLTIDHARVILDKLPETWGQPGSGTWYRVAAALHLQFEGSDEAYQLLDEWSQGLEGYDEDANRRRWDAGFSHTQGRGGITTFRNLVFESIQNGGLKVKPETMRKWGLARAVDEDFDGGGTETPEATLPEYADLDRMSDIGGMITEDAPPVEWLVEGLIPRGNVTFLAGGSGTSKSYFALEVCGLGAVGVEEFAGLQLAEGGFRTLYLAYEDSNAATHIRVREVEKYIGQRVDILGDGEYRETLRGNLMMLTSEVLDSGAWALVKSKKKYEAVDVTPLAQYMKDYVSSRGIDLVVFDTGSETHTGDENSAADMVVLMRVMRQLATSTNCAVLVIQHVAKGIWSQRIVEINQASIRGSSVLVDKSRNVFMLARMPRVDAGMFGLPDDAATHENYVVLKHVKANLGGYVAMKVFERTNRGLLIYRPEVVERDATDIAAVEETEGPQAQRRTLQFERLRTQIVDFIAEQNANDVTPSSSMVRTHAMTQFGVSDSRARTVLDWLESEGHVERVVNPDYPRSANWRLTNSGQQFISNK